MGNFTIIAMLITGVIWISTMTSCDGFLGGGSVSIAQRITRFETDLNKAARNTLYLHFHPTETTNWDAIKDAEFWNQSSLSFADQPFDIITGAAVAQSNGRSLVTGTLENTNITFDVQFIMLQDNEDWYIEELILLDPADNSEYWAVRQLGVQR